MIKLLTIFSWKFAVKEVWYIADDVNNENANSRKWDAFPWKNRQDIFRFLFELFQLYFKIWMYCMGGDILALFWFYFIINLMMLFAKARKCLKVLAGLIFALSNWQLIVASKGMSLHNYLFYELQLYTLSACSNDSVYISINFKVSGVEICLCWAEFLDWIPFKSLLLSLLL